MLNTNKNLQESKQKAIIELIAFITDRADYCINTYDYSFYCTDKGPESYKDLKAMTINRHIPIADYGNDKSIYGAKYNIAFRFYHDCLHLIHDLGFSTLDELKISEIHMRQGYVFGLSSLALQMLEADTKGQVLYYANQNEFVNNQIAFIDSCLDKSINVAVRIPH